jgi:putative ABC transport system permease protein
MPPRTLAWSEVGTGVAAVWLVIRTLLRARWRSWLVLAVLAGLAGGMVIAVAAGARRTDAAYPSLIAWSAGPDALVAPGRERVPQVSEAAAVTAYGVLSPAVLDVYAPADSRIPDSFWHRKLLAGRPADSRRADEAEVEFTAAQALHLAPGSRLCVELIGASGGAVPFCFRVVAVDATPGDFPPEYGTGTDTVWATPAFARTVGGRLAGSQIAVVRLRRGAADLPAVEHQAAGPAGGSTLTAYPYGPQEANTERSIHQQAIVLWLLAGVLAVVGLLVFGQLLARLTALESAGFGVQRTLGMTSGQLTAVGLARAAMIGAVGAVLAAGIAAAASPLFPVGLAAEAEPHPGFRADWVALGLGMAGVAVGVVACGAWPAARAANWRRNRAALAVRRPPRGASLGRLPLPVAGEAGIRLVLHRGAGRTALPVWSAVTAAAVGVAGLSAAVVFGASLGNLLASPALYGVTWDAQVAYPQSGGSLGPATRIIAADPEVVQWTSAHSSVPVEVDGAQVGAITNGPGPDGSLAAVPADGTPPLRDDEIVLGRRTLAAIGRQIGQTVTVSLVGTQQRATMRIVGTAIFPPMDDTLVLGTGAELTVGGLRELLPSAASVPTPDGILVKFRSGVATSRATADLAARLDRAGPFVVIGPGTPADLVNFGQLQGLPLVLGLTLGALGVLTVAHLLLTSVRRRLRDLMVLRVLGFTGGEVRAAVSSMSLTVTALGLAAGIPAGLICGRVAWRFLTAQLGVDPQVVAPVQSFALLVAAGLALAVAVTAVPGLRASRILPAAILRAELRDLVDHVDEAVPDGPALDETGRLLAAGLAEEALAGPDHDGEDEQPQLVHEVVLEQRAPELIAGVDDDVPVQLLLQPGDLLDNVALQDRHVGPRGVVEGRGHDVLGHAVQPVRPLASPGRPARPEPLVAAPAEQQGRGAQGFGIRDLGEPVDVLAARTAEPAAPPEALLAVGILHHSVERYVRADDDLSHRGSPRSSCQPSQVNTPRRAETGRP